MPIFCGLDVAGRFRAARGIILLLLSGLAFTITPPVATLAQIAPPERPASADPYAAHVAEASQRFGVPATWSRAVMRAESAGDVRAISSAGAMGLMQIMPDTWADLRVRHRLGGDPYDPRDNILAGAAYLREMYDRYGSPGFLAAYNAGPGRYEEYLSGARSLPAETRAYVRALAPFVGGGDIVGPVTVATAEPVLWTRAPLFVARADAASAAGPVQSDGRSGDTADAPGVRGVSAIAPQSSGLFVARSSAGEP
ncbi:MAG: lytic transglycosylase domain-containing protein [Bauldia sp.]